MPAAYKNYDLTASAGSQPPARARLSSTSGGDPAAAPAAAPSVASSECGAGEGHTEGSPDDGGEQDDEDEEDDDEVVDTSAEAGPERKPLSVWEAALLAFKEEQRQLRRARVAVTRKKRANAQVGCGGGG